MSPIRPICQRFSLTGRLRPVNAAHRVSVSLTNKGHGMWLFRYKKIRYVPGLAAIDYQSSVMSDEPALNKSITHGISEW
jgi:hypothetical protein